MLKTEDLRHREVINLSDGRRLGYIIDLEIDLESGRVTALIVPGQGGRILGLFGRDNDLIIPWERIRKIGTDVILVDSPGLTSLRHNPHNDRPDG
ncbi:MAG: YlmC/YmxH family sporulation protein [Bacillota bacterium]